jgi:hypothetical protein
VKRFLEKERLTLSQSFAVRLLGIGALLDSLTVEMDGASVSARAHAPTETLAGALEKALKYLSPAEKPR